MENKTVNILVIFGATGDLASRKIFPAINEIYNSNKLPENLHIIGCGRKELKSNIFKELSSNLSEKSKYLKLDPSLDNDYKVLVNELENFQKQFANELIKTGQFKGEQQEVQLPQHIEEQFEASYVDNRAINGQRALDYIMHSQELHDKFQKAWFHFLVSGECYTHRGVRNNEPFYEILNPLDVDYDLDPDLDFVEDGDWAIVRKYVHASSVIDTFYEYLTEQQILELCEKLNYV